MLWVNHHTLFTEITVIDSLSETTWIENLIFFQPESRPNPSRWNVKEKNKRNEKKIKRVLPAVAQSWKLHVVHEASFCK